MTATTYRDLIRASAASAPLARIRVARTAETIADRVVATIERQESAR
jgi:hypothetical protein